VLIYYYDIYILLYKYNMKRRKSNKSIKRTTKKWHKGGRSRKRNGAFKTLKCSPASKQAFKDTCYDHGDLIKLKQLWNKHHPDKAIQSTNSESIWSSLKQHMSTICDKESCWLKQFAKEVGIEKELIDSFAPKSPEEWKTKPNAWLSNIDISKVMEQYKDEYDCFNFYGPSPIDWNTKKSNKCVTDELCTFELSNEIKNGKTKIGIVFNLDPHYKGGSHWVSLFINVKKGLIFFFDSAGATCPKKIRIFVDKVKEQGEQLGIKFKFDQNYPTKHQYTTTECGVYSLYFIVHMLKDKLTSQYLKTHKIGDKFIEGYRKIFFNPDL